MNETPVNFAQLFEKYRSQIPPVGPEEMQRYVEHFALLCSWNEHIGLVSRKSIDRSFANHYVDSIYIASFAHKHLKGRKIFDIGSGAGFPGLIFAIRYADVAVTLYEKMLKKQSFLLAAVAQLGLKNVVVEGAVPDQRQEGVFLGRAVFQRPDLFPFLRKHLVRSALFIATSGGLKEPEACPNDFCVLEREKYTLPEDAGSRYVECIGFVPRGTK